MALVARRGGEDAAIYLAAAFTGLRLGELLALRWRDVDFAGALIRVRASYAAGARTTPSPARSGRCRWRRTSPPRSRTSACEGIGWGEAPLTLGDRVAGFEQASGGADAVRDL